MHTGGARRRGKGRPRILYWFRTPPGVRIGRSALDESAIRLIEEHNPDVEFDWTRILKGQDSPVDAGGPSQDRRGKPRRDFPPRSGSQASSAAVQSRHQPPRPPAEAAPPSVPPITSPPDTAEPQVDEIGDVQNRPESGEVAHEPERAAAPDAGLSPLTADAADETRFDSISSPSTCGPEVEITSAAQARLGSEGLSRLRARHAEVLARISETVTDPVRRDELKSQAERLNPDTWVTDAEVTEGLESYETVFESLRSVVGRRNKRRRRSGRRASSGGSSGVPDAAASDAGEEVAGPEDVGEDL